MATFLLDFQAWLTFDHTLLNSCCFFPSVWLCNFCTFASKLLLGLSSIFSGELIMGLQRPDLLWSHFTAFPSFLPFVHKLLTGFSSHLLGELIANSPGLINVCFTSLNSLPFLASYWSNSFHESTDKPFLRFISNLVGVSLWDSHWRTE